MGYYDPSESEEEEEEESEDDARYKPKKGRYLSAKQMKAPKPKLPPVSEMVIESIKALKENPRKGSSLRDIRERGGHGRNSTGQGNKEQKGKKRLQRTLHCS